jgi:thioredoxin 1
MEKQIKDIREFQEKIAEEQEGNLFTRGDMKERIQARMDFLREEVNELEKALLAGDPVETIDAVIDIHYIANGTAQEAGVIHLLGDAWDLVHANNMSKLDENGKVHKNEQGKVIKPANYKPVDLKQLFDDSLEDTVKSVKILKFYADWCAPCRTLTTVLDGHDFPIKTINTDLEPETTLKFNVRNVPTLVFIDEEENVLHRLTGVVTSDKVKEILDELRANKED